MGNICMNKELPCQDQKVKDRTNVNTFSFINSNSSHDNQFLGYLDINKLNQLIRQLICGKCKQQQILQQLSIFYNQIGFQIQQLNTQNSKTNTRLNHIKTIIHQGYQGYIILQIQQIQLFQLPSQLNIQIIIDMKSSTFKKNISINNIKSSLAGLFMQSPICGKHILIKVNSYTYTLDISQIKNQILILQKLNLKDNTDIFISKGSLIVRIQYFQQIDIWKSQCLQKLKLKQIQIQTIINCLQKLIDLGQQKNIQMLLKYIQQSGSIIKDENVPSSFYSNQFQI